MSYTLFNRSDLERDGAGGSVSFEGYHYGARVTVILVDEPPGSGPRLHRHPYEGVFIIEMGHATYSVGEEALEASAGQIIVVPPNTPHTFVNSGQGPLRQVDIHVNDRFITEWLEE